MPKKLPEVDVWFYGLPRSVQDLIKKWQPQNCETEKDYENYLYHHLREALPDGIKVTKQYGAGRITIDIVVNQNVAIELKSKFKLPADLVRLLGQVELMQDHFEEICLVICGNKDDNLIHELKDKTRRKSNGSNIEVIEK